MPKQYGYELIMDLHECPTTIMTKGGVENYCKRVCELIDMNPEDFHIWASNPEDYDSDSDHLHGVSAVQFITTSSLVIHTLPKMKRIYINIFSCKRFEAKDVSDFTKDYFAGQIVSITMLMRH